MTLEHADQYCAHSEIAATAREAQTWCESHGVYGYHYTRGFKQDFTKMGLTSRSGCEIRKAFLKSHGGNFDSQQLTRLEDAWRNYFSPCQQDARDDVIYFLLRRHFSPDAANSAGVDSLLRCFGGEQVNMPICDQEGLEDISDVLCNLGSPLAIKCKLDTRHMRSSERERLGHAIISTFHCQFQCRQTPLDLDVRYSQAICPFDVEIIDLSACF
jgi:hypothetical protein